MGLDVPLAQIKNSRVLHRKITRKKKCCKGLLNAKEGRPVLSNGSQSSPAGAAGAWAPGGGPETTCKESTHCATRRQ